MCSFRRQILHENSNGDYNFEKNAVISRKYRCYNVKNELKMRCTFLCNMRVLNFRGSKKILYFISLKVYNFNA